MMMTEEGHERDGSGDDLPKIVAWIIATAPPLMLKVGYQYLAMKRRVRKSARAMEAGMRKSGMPEDLARRLATRYEEDSRFVEIIMKSFMNKGTLRSCVSSSDNDTGN